MKYRAILFDLDGTLLDTLEDLADSMNAVLAEMGFPQHPVERYKVFVGDGVENLARRVLPETSRDDATVAECVGRMRDTYGRRWDLKTRPYEGIPELLDELSARGLAMTVLSNKPDDFTRLCVGRLLPKWTFATVRGEDPRTPRKPDPSAALRIAEDLGLSPAEFLYLGDTNTDMRTAVAAGMLPVGALWGFRPAEELLASGAKALVARPLDVLGLLG